MKEKREIKIADQTIKLDTTIEEMSKILSTDILTPKVKLPKSKCFCTIKQFAYFVEGKEYQKKTILKQMSSNEEPDHPFWFQTAYSSIAKSLREEDHIPIYDGISKLKMSNPTGKQGKHNKKLSIEALEKYKNLYLPLNYRQLKKIPISAKEISTKSYNFSGIEIKVTPDFIFRAQINGKKIVGGVRVNIKTGLPFNDCRMKVVSFLLFKHLELNIAKDDEIVLPEFCICIDVYRGKCMQAPTGTNVPHTALQTAAIEFRDRWKQF